MLSQRKDGMPEVTYMICAWQPYFASPGHLGSIFKWLFKFNPLKTVEEFSPGKRSNRVTLLKLRNAQAPRCPQCSTHEPWLWRKLESQ